MDRHSALPTAPRRASNRRGEVTRAALVDAGWRLVDRMTIADLLASLQASDVAREAGRTSGAFFHHFDSPDDFVAAMVEAFRLGVDGDRLKEVIEASAAAPLPNVAQLLRDTAGAAWDVWSTDAHVALELRRFLLLTALGDRPGSVGEVPSHMEVVRTAVWDQHLDALELGFKEHWARIGREPREPFDHRSVALVITSMLMGMSMANASGVDVPTEVVAEMMPALIAGMSRPVGRLGDNEALDAELEPPGVVAAALDLDDPATAEMLVRIGDRARADGIGVQMLAIAAAAGVSLRAAVAMFGTPRRAAALSVRGDLEEIREGGWRYLDSDPQRALCDVLVSLARTARRWGSVAFALLDERAGVDRSVNPPTRAEILEQVPLAGIVVEPIRRLGAVPEAKLVDTADLVIDVVLQVAASRVRMAPHDVASLGLRLLDA